MKYIGSKNRLSKDLVPIIQSYINKNTKGYLEPFVGGANMIDKIKCSKKIGCDTQKRLIALLKHVSITVEDLPSTISEYEYNIVKNNKDKYEDWYVGPIGFCSTFGAKYFGGYARDRKGNRDISNEGIRNLKKQAPNLKDIIFLNCSFLDLPKDKIKGYVIYCDPPYKGTLKYKTEDFPYEEFYQWCRDMSKHNMVLISEYNMPNDFECIWTKESKVNFDSGRQSNDSKNIRVEKLFTYKNK